MKFAKYGIWILAILILLNTFTRIVDLYRLTTASGRVVGKLENVLPHSGRGPVHWVVSFGLNGVSRTAEVVGVGGGYPEIGSAVPMIYSVNHPGTVVTAWGDSGIRNLEFEIVYFGIMGTLFCLFAVGIGKLVQNETQVNRHRKKWSEEEPST